MQTETKSFINDDFLLKTKTARHLYHSYAENLPIIDYHCHISPQEIAEDKRFTDITDLWLGGDHYKWRLIRMTGVPEAEITGDADSFTKFKHFAEALQYAVGNPMYHWTHLELKRYFDCDLILGADTAEEVYKHCNSYLKKHKMTAKSIITSSNVKFIGTTDDPSSDLVWHLKIQEDKSFKTIVAPSFRPDKAVNIDKPGFADYIESLFGSAPVRPRVLREVLFALDSDLNAFDTMGCRAADHGLDFAVFSLPSSYEEVNEIFRKGMEGAPLTREEADKYKTAMLLFCGYEYAKRGFAMQIHYNCQRQVNSRYSALLDPDTGFDCIRTHDGGAALTALLDAMDKENKLPKTILYSLNPADNELLDTVAGSFPGEDGFQKVQHGAAWWFNDTKSGMEAQLRSYANLLPLGEFIGMLTDSRSFLSYTRHEYFRRILCNMLGELVENGEYPNDDAILKELVERICYKNAAKFFDIK